VKEARRTVEVQWRGRMAKRLVQESEKGKMVYG